MGDAQGGLYPGNGHAGFPQEEFHTVHPCQLLQSAGECVKLGSILGSMHGSQSLKLHMDTLSTTNNFVLDLVESLG